MAAVALKLHPGGFHSGRVAENGINSVLGEGRWRNMLQREPPGGVLLPGRDEGDLAPACSTHSARVLFVGDHQKCPVGRDLHDIRRSGWRGWLRFVWIFFGNREGKREISASLRKVNPK